MDFSNPWDNIQVQAIHRKTDVQYFDSRIHIVYVLLGEMTLKGAQTSVKLRKDDFYILSKTEKYELDVKSKGKAFYFTLDYFVKNSNDNYIYAFKGNSIATPRATDGELIYQLKQLLLMKTLKDNRSYSKVYQQYFTLLTLLESYYQVELRNNNQQNIKGQVEELKFYIDNNFDKDIKLSDLAEQLYVTEQYLSRVFKAQNGIGISEYLIKRRLAKVRQLLLETEDSITDIAYSAGFSNINSFNRIFKKYQGMTPSTYRSEVKSHLTVTTVSNKEGSRDYEDLRDYLQDESETPKVKDVVINQEKALPFDIHKLMINLGYAGDLLHSSMMKEMEIARAYTSFKYGRVWGLLNDSILNQKGEYFDFGKVDEILQSVLDLKLIPFLDLGLKGKLIHDSVSDVLTFEPFQLPYHDLDAILKRYQAFMAHVVERYGVDEVATWKIEIWKPSTHVLQNMKQEDLALVTTPDGQLDLTVDEDYVSFFTQVKRTLQEQVPELAVGGSGISLDLEEDAYQSFLGKWAAQGDKPDFLSLVVYTLDIMNAVGTEEEGAFISSNVDFSANRLKEVRQALDEFDLCSELVVSEFNITNSGRDLINDAAFKGPYIVRNLLAVLEWCDVIGYWQFSDLPFATFDVNRHEIFGGGGLISKNGIAKPSFYAFDFVNALGDQLLYLSDGIVVTKKGRKLVALLYHYCHLNSSYYYSNQEKFNKLTIESLFENDGDRHYQLKIDQVQDDNRYKIKTRRIGVKTSSFLTEANQVSIDDDFSREEINYLKLRCIPLIQRESKTVKQGRLNLSFTLAPHDMLLVEIGG